MQRGYDLGREILKLLAVFTMTIDHIGAILYPEHLVFRYIGRISFPLFTYLLVLGLEGTRNTKNYFLRLLVFAFISQIPFFLSMGIQPWEHLNIFFTLSSGVLFIHFYKKNNILLILPLLFASVLPFDYGIYGILTISCMYFLMKDKRLGSVSFILLNFLFWPISSNQFLSIFALPMILVHNMGILNFSNSSKKEYPKWKKYAFYVYYPLHLAILYFFRLAS